MDTDPGKLIQQQKKEQKQDIRKTIWRSLGFGVAVAQFYFNGLALLSFIPGPVILAGNIVLSFAAIVAFFLAAKDTEKRLQKLESVCHANDLDY